MVLLVIPTQIFHNIQSNYGEILFDEGTNTQPSGNNNKF